MNASDRFTRAEHVVRVVVDALLESHGLEPYWFDFPFEQNELTSGDLLRDGRVPSAVLERVTSALKEED
jgi:hypothetical protein